MNISKEQAQEALEAVQQTTRQTRRAVANGGGAHALIIWGTVWFLGFLISHFIQDVRQGFIWLILNLAGAGATAFVIWRTRGRIRGQSDRRVGVFWLAILLYTVLLMAINPIEDPRQFVMYFVVMSMFGYVVMGLWARAKVIGVTGVVTTIFAAASYFLLPEYFFLAMAVLGGGSLIGGGVYMLRQWR